MLPDKVKISGITYTISRDKDAEMECGGCNAEIRYTNSEIVVKSTLKKDYEQEVFIHELVHGMCHAIGRRDLREDEQFTEQFAQILYQVLKDNKLYFGGE